MNLSDLNLPPLFYTLLPFIALLDVLLRGLCLWKSAQAGQKWWFVALLVVNSLGILPGIYLLTHRQPKSPQPEYLPPQPELPKTTPRSTSGRFTKKTP